MSERELHTDEERDEAPAAPPIEVPVDVPEADAAEQALPIVEGETGGTQRVEDRPEADALDQDRVEDLSADEERGQDDDAGS